MLLASFATLSLATAAYFYKSHSDIDASGHGLHVPSYKWPSSGILDSYDAKSLRRGYQVYREVCSTCHSMEYIAFRNLKICFNEQEIKAIAADTEIKYLADDGEMKTRPGIPADFFPSPYDNEKQAALANGGAVPPDLSLIVKARMGGEDYVFGILTGYSEPPAGFKTADGVYYNPYFPGSQISMAPPLNNDHQLTFPDGTEASVSQMAKDVAHFLSFVAAPEMEERKQFGIKTILSMSGLVGIVLYLKRFRWAPIKYRRLVVQGSGTGLFYNTIKKSEDEKL